MKKILTIEKKIFNVKNRCLIINHQWSRGQALVTLLFFMIIGISITTAAVISVVNSVSAATVHEQGTDASVIAESGIDEGLLHLLRNPSFTGTENFAVGDGNVTITIGKNNILATGSADNAVKTIQVQTVYNNNTLSVSSRKEL